MGETRWSGVKEGAVGGTVFVDGVRFLGASRVGRARQGEHRGVVCRGNDRLKAVALRPTVVLAGTPIGVAVHAAKLGWNLPDNTRSRYARAPASSALQGMA